MDLSEARMDGRPAEDRIEELSRVILVVLLLVTLWHFL
jgi:hypothetical protein